MLRLLRHPETVPPGAPGLFAVGLLAAAVSGYLAIRWLLRYLQSRSLLPFVIYRIALGAALLAYVGVGR